MSTALLRGLGTHRAVDLGGKGSRLCLREGLRGGLHLLLGYRRVRSEALRLKFRLGDEKPLCLELSLHALLRLRHCIL